MIVDPLTTVPDELWAWVTDTPEGRSIVGVLTEYGHTPLVFARKAVALRAEPLARGHGRSLHQPVRLVHFRAEPVPGDTVIPAHEAIAFLRMAVDFAYRQGLHEIGYDPVEVIEAELRRAANDGGSAS